MNKGTIVAVLDLETTGLEAETSEIIEIGVVKHLIGSDQVEEFHTLVRCGELPPFITELTGLTSERLMLDGEEITQAIRRLKNFLSDADLVVSQFVPFDFSFLAKYDIVPRRYICTRSLSKRLNPEHSSSLRPTYERLFGETLPRQHDALGDARAALRILLHQVAIAESLGMEYINVLVNSPERPLRYIPPLAKVVNL